METHPSYQVDHAARKAYVTAITRLLASSDDQVAFPGGSLPNILCIAKVSSNSIGSNTPDLQLDRLPLMLLPAPRLSFEEPGQERIRE